MTTKTILLNDIRIDGQTQSRVAINQECVVHYADLMGEKVQLPPVIVFFDGVDHWLADGFHRYHATSSLGIKANIVADVRKGTRRDAVLFSLNANVPHGLTLTSDDKRKAAMTMLADTEWCELSDRAIARHCGCSHTLVSQLRTPGNIATPKPAKTGNIATTAPVETGNIATQDALESPQSSSQSTKAEPPAKTQKQIEVEQNAEDAHGGSDPIAMLEEAQKQIEGLQKELFALSADDQKAETLKWRRVADVATRRQNELMDTVNSREKELQRFANWLNRIGKVLGEDDHAKLPALVEALARKAK